MARVTNSRQRGEADVEKSIYWGYSILDSTTIAVKDSIGNWVDTSPGDTVDVYSLNREFYYKKR